MKKVIFLLSVMVIGFTVGYGGYSMTYARHHHHGPIPGVDVPFNPAAYYSPTALDYEDSPSEFTYRDLAANGGNVYDYARHIKSILFAKNALAWLQAALEKTGIDILNATPLDEQKREQNQNDIFVMHQVAMETNRLPDMMALLNGDTFRSSDRYDEDTNGYDTQTQREAVENVTSDMIQAMQAYSSSMDDQSAVYQSILQDAANAVGDLQAEQAVAEAEAFQAAQQAQRNALISDSAALKALQKKIEENDTLAYQRSADAQMLHFPDPFHRSALEQKEYESTHPSAPKGFAVFK